METRDNSSIVKAVSKRLITQRPRRKRIGGRDVRIKNTASASNAKPRKVSLVHGGSSRKALYDPLDKRTVEHRFCFERKQALLAHLAGNATVLEQELVEQEARLAMLARIAWVAIEQGNLLADDGLAPAAEAYVRLTREQRAVMQLLGIQRRTELVPDLQSYLSSTHAEQR